MKQWPLNPQIPQKPGKGAFAISITTIMTIMVMGVVDAEVQRNLRVEKNNLQKKFMATDLAAVTMGINLRRKL